MGWLQPVACLVPRCRGLLTAVCWGKVACHANSMGSWSAGARDALCWVRYEREQNCVYMLLGTPLVPI